MYHIYVCSSGFSVFKDHKYMYQYLPNLKYIINNTILSKKKRHTNGQTNIFVDYCLKYYHYLISSENHFIIIVKHFFGK